MKASHYLTGIRRHESTVLQEIFREYLPGIRLYVGANHGTDEDAEDLFMDALEAIYRQITEKGLSDLSCSFYTYLYEICKRLWLKKLRRGKYQSGVTPENLMVLTDDEDPHKALEETERHGLFWEKFTLLGQDCQEVLRLSLLDQLSAEEIARYMDYASPGYARKKKHECKEQLVGYIVQDARYEEVRFS
jgi:RNA polymerase sigma factor (sigma-70 family)